MEPKDIDRSVTRFQLNLPDELRERLDNYVNRANALFYPLTLTKTGVMLAALEEYLDRHEPDVSTDQGGEA